MKTENENNDEQKKRRAPACEVFDMLTAHAEKYQNAITISKVQQDVRDTFGVILDRGAISSRLRNIADKGLIERTGGESRGWWVFSERVLRTLGKSNPAAPERAAGRSLLKVPRNKRATSKQFGEKGKARQDIEEFIAVTKKPGQKLVFTKEAVTDFIRLRDQRAVSKKRVKQIAKAISNMRDHQRGIVKTDQFGVYCVPADDDRYTKSTARRPDVAVPKGARRQATKPTTSTELRELFREAAEGYATVQKALVRLSDLVGNFKE